MKRRDCLKAMAATAAWFLKPNLRDLAYPQPATKDRSAGGRKAPFRVLFSNDTTNILSCESPYHKRGEPFKPEMLEATVDETAATGVEVHLLQPGMGWVPWWNSKIYPIAEHRKWWREHYGVEPRNSVHDYLLQGGDLVAVFVKRCRQCGLKPFISLRLNDAHHLNYADRPKNRTASHSICRFYVEHPEYRIDGKGAGRLVQNWDIPEVRAYKFAFISELCENYDIDGFELDFMRYPRFFRLDETTSSERRRIMADFISDVRNLLDRTAKTGRRRWLCARVPAYLSEYDALGLDPSMMADAGVDMLNLSIFYFTEQQTDLAKIRTAVPGAAIYLEMTHCIAIGKRVGKGGDNFIFRRTTDEQFYTAAHLAYARGADGVSAFNFVYYREHGTPGRGPFDEPPFHVFKHMGDPSWLARQPQHYFLSDHGYVNRYLPKKLAKGASISFTMDIAPPAGGWKKEGKLRIQTRQNMGNARLKARINKVKLEPSGDVSEPYPNPYPPMLGTPETLRAWTVPPGVLKDGLNDIEITMLEGTPADVIFLDIAAG